MIIEQIWPQWKVEGEIGRGSYGVVYKCCRDNNGIKEYYDLIRVADDWVYYQKGDDTYRIRTDGSEREYLPERD